MKTFNRGKLAKLATAGKLVIIGSMAFDDQHGQEESKKVMPVRIRESYEDRKEGFANLFASDFKSKSGCAYQNADGSITLIVHSNCSHEFKIVA